MLSTIHRALRAKGPTDLLLGRFHTASVSASSVGASHHADGTSRSMALPSCKKTLPSDNNIDSLLYPRLYQRPAQMYSSLATRYGVMSSRGKELHRSNNVVAQNYCNPIQNAIRTNFSYAGPRKLSDILKTELLDDKSSAEIVSIQIRFLK